MNKYTETYIYVYIQIVFITRRHALRRSQCSVDKGDTADGNNQYLNGKDSYSGNVIFFVIVNCYHFFILVY